MLRQAHHIRKLPRPSPTSNVTRWHCVFRSGRAPHIIQITHCDLNTDWPVARAVAVIYLRAFSMQNGFTHTRHANVVSGVLTSTKQRSDHELNCLETCAIFAWSLVTNGRQLPVSKMFSCIGAYGVRCSACVVPRWRATSPTTKSVTLAARR
eukprot:6203253-Pleurochrysis_carterae.AAC.4